MNPYDWNRPDPTIEIPRSEVVPVVEQLRRGNGVVILAGRGLGKSVLLQQVRRSLEQSPDVRVILFREPPAQQTLAACFEDLARELGVSPSGVLKASDLVRAYFDRDVPPNLVLLYDEFDRYARPLHGASSDPPGRAFFNSLQSMLEHEAIRGVGILAAASIGLYLFRDALGSSFISKAARQRIRPFDRSEIEILSRPFADRGEPLAVETLEALHLASGGNPALATYGLESLWELEISTERDVAEIFIDFQERNKEFLRSFQLSFADPMLSEAPQRVWDLIRQSDGEMFHVALQEACSPAGPLLQLDFGDVLDILAASGLVRIKGSVKADPVVVQPINSILSLPTVPSAIPDLRERLRQDLQTLLHRLHVSSADFFRPGKDGKQLVPEAVFAAFLTLGFELLGWQVAREAQRGAGRTDLLLHRAGGEEMAIVETKIWGRRGYREVHQQVAGYWTAGTSAGAVVMLTDAEVVDWPERYRRECLVDCSEVRLAATDSTSPTRARFEASSRTLDGMSVEVEHFLLRLARGR